MRVESKHQSDERAQQLVAGAVAGPIGRLFAFDAAAYHHVKPTLEQPFYHQPDARRVVCRISVHQYVDVCFYIGEHTTYDEAFASVLLQKHGCAGSTGDGSGIVR